MPKGVGVDTVVWHIDLYRCAPAGWARYAATAHVLTQLHHMLEVTPDVLDVSVFALAMTTEPSFLAPGDSLTTSLPGLFILLTLLVVDGWVVLAATQGVAVRAEPTHRREAGDWVFAVEADCPKRLLALLGVVRYRWIFPFRGRAAVPRGPRACQKGIRVGLVVWQLGL